MGQNARERRVKGLIGELEVQARQIVAVEIETFDVRLADHDLGGPALIASSYVFQQSLR